MLINYYVSAFTLQIYDTPKLSIIKHGIKKLAKQVLKHLLISLKNKVN